MSSVKGLSLAAEMKSSQCKNAQSHEDQSCLFPRTRTTSWWPRVKTIASLLLVWTLPKHKARSCPLHSGILANPLGLKSSRHVPQRSTVLDWPWTNELPQPPRGTSTPHSMAKTWQSKTFREEQVPLMKQIALFSTVKLSQIFPELNSWKMK